MKTSSVCLLLWNIFILVVEVMIRNHLWRPPTQPSLHQKYVLQLGRAGHLVVNLTKVQGQLWLQGCLDSSVQMVCGYHWWQNSIRRVTVTSRTKVHVIVGLKNSDIYWFHYRRLWAVFQGGLQMIYFTLPNRWCFTAHDTGSVCWKYTFI